MVNKELSIEEAILKYYADSKDNEKLLSDLLTHTQYLDLLIHKLKEDPIGEKLLIKIKAEIDLENSVIESTESSKKENVDVKG